MGVNGLEKLTSPFSAYWLTILEFDTLMESMLSLAAYYEVYV